MPAAPIDIRELTTVAAIAEAGAVLDAVWPGDRQTMPSNLLRALQHAGNYVVGLFDADGMIGASAGFFGPPESRSLHSHVTGILPTHRGRGLGRVLKQHQREWALARGIAHITWTFDPLIARNAHFNLAVLGATVREYLVDQYGPMADAVNRGDATDRLLADWRIAEPATPPILPEAVESSIGVPADIESLRRTAPTEAARWRLRVREQFLRATEDGLMVGGFDDRRGYLLTRP